MIEPIEAWGCEPLHLPHYVSPERNPVGEEAYFNVKGIVRYEKLEPARPLVEAIAVALRRSRSETDLWDRGNEHLMRYWLSSHTDRSRPISSCDLKMSFS